MNYVVNSKEMAELISSMANVECHEVAPTAELKRLAEVLYSCIDDDCSTQAPQNRAF